MNITFLMQKPYWLHAWFLLTTIIAFTPVAMSQSTGSETLFKACAVCHGELGQGNIELQSPSLQGQDAAYIKNQIMAFLKGWRGSRADDIQGQQMQAALVSLADQEEKIDALAGYIANLPLKNSRSTTASEGDVSRVGQNLYNGNCGTCHGNRAQGNAALNAPRLNLFSKAYLKKQYLAFQNGYRGTAKDDKFGKQMAFMAKTISDEEQLEELLDYIGSQQ